MKFFHTADWHLGKLVQNVYMTEDQRHILKEFIKAIEEEKPDAVIIAGDLYDRGVPPTEAVNLLDDVLETIVLKLNTPVLAIAGNHDSPSRLHFGSKMMKSNGYHMVGQISKQLEPVVLKDQHGEVHFHLIPYADPSIIRYVFKDEEIKTHNEAMKKITDEIAAKMDQNARHVFVGHAFVTPTGEKEDNTSESERPLSIGGAEHVSAVHFDKFDYTALGHLHQAHFVLNEAIQYSGSPLKYSISEEKHKKGFLVVEMDDTGKVEIEKRLLTPARDMRTVEARMDELVKYPTNEDYVFVQLLDEAPVLMPMEKVRSVYPNAMHVERVIQTPIVMDGVGNEKVVRTKMDDLSLFKAFYQEVKGMTLAEETEEIFLEVLQELIQKDSEQPAEKTAVTNKSSSQGSVTF
ncbi:exonuclease SbcCD subunit D [Bacillus sp. OK048]|uniref:exonuclease SbcCD subunit D n=1 Tax=Bacillus sp. OK048 TaxID=1882761 RepID=UPI00088D6D99|nr:exonuclease SbcCD subunit D [Bacillus sp. OK048]SDM41230.1 Exodeoxyribonuclease I subunit D [Bacillus sp. OK048]